VSAAHHPSWRLWRLADWVNVVIYAVILYELVRILFAPTDLDVEKIQTVSVMILVEFILLHSGVFMSVFPRKISLFLLVPAYGFFIYFFNQALDGNGVLWLYMGVIATRMRFAFFDNSIVWRVKGFLFSGFAMMIYMIAVLPGAYLTEYYPQFGLTDDFISRNDLGDLDADRDDPFSWPHIAVIQAITYLTFMILYEIKFYGLLGKPLLDDYFKQIAKDELEEASRLS